MSEVLITTAVFALLFAPLALLMGALWLKSGRAAANTEATVPERGPRQQPTGPWYKALPRYFPSYYSHAALTVVVALCLAQVAFRMVAAGLRPSWLYALPLAPASLVVGHAGAYVLDFVRARTSSPRPGDVAQPVAYYTPDMPPASYQPTFRTLSSLISFTPFVLVVLGLLLAVQIVMDPSPNWPVIFRISYLAGLLGFWLGCLEIRQGLRATRS